MTLAIDFLIPKANQQYVLTHKVFGTHRLTHALTQNPTPVSEFRASALRGPRSLNPQLIFGNSNIAYVSSEVVRH